MPADKVVFLLVVLAVRLPRVVCQCDARTTTLLADGYPMSVGEKVRFVLQPRGVYGWLTLGLCGRDSCSAVSVLDERENNDRVSLRLQTTTTNAVQSFLTTKRKFNTTLQGFQKGQNYTFFLQRTNTKSFDFWMEREPSLRLTAETTPDQLRLKWSTDLGSLFSVPEAALGDYELAEGQEVRVRLKTSKKFEWDKNFDVGLCGPTTCDKMVIWFASDGPNPEMGYEVRHMHSNSLVGEIFEQQERQGPKGVFDTNSTYAFVIRRRSGAVDVWLDGVPTSKITFVSNNKILRVMSWVGSTYFVNEHAEKVRKKFGATCGRAKAGVQTYVINGDKTDVDKVPWHAIIYRKLKGTWTGICGGTLVAPSSVVTAAHCVTSDSGQPLPAADYFVGLGKTLSGWDKEDDDEAIYKSEVKRIFVHKWYKGHKTKFANDIAILEISACAKLGDKIFPACTEGIVQDNATPMKVAGWGNGSSPLAELETAQLPFVSTEDCRTIMGSDADYFAFVTDDKFCSYRRSAQQGSQGVINGDSGGGAMVKRGGVWHLLGVVSTKMSAVRDGAELEVYTFTDVNHHLGWISRFLSW